MPAVLDIVGYRVRVYTADHFPLHVHIIQGGSLIVIYLSGQKGSEPETLWVREVHAMSRRQERQALEIVAANYDLLLAAWEEIHG